MAQIVLSDDELAKRISESLGKELENLVFEEMLLVAQPIIRKVAQEACKNISNNIQTYRSYEGKKIEMTLVINGVPEGFEK